MTDQPALRDRIAAALAREDAHNCGYDHGFTGEYGVDAETDGIIDAVLAVLPAPVDRAAVLREAADFVGNDDDCDCGGCDSCVPNKLAAGLRRMADEAQQPEEALCGKTVGVGFPDHPYRPCARPAGHSEAYCRDATGQHYFLAAADQPDAEPEEAGR